jgi:hypothetical protein
MQGQVFGIIVMMKYGGAQVVRLNLNPLSLGWVVFNFISFNFLTGFFDWECPLLLFFFQS